jgi:hypothetical protein
MDELELALDDCLQRLASRKANLAQCLARYPQFAEQLRPMLETALEVQRGKQVRAPGAVRDRTRDKLLQYIEAHPQQREKKQVIPRLAIIIVGLVCALLTVGTGAAQAAMPGQILYGLKLSSERVWRAAAPDPVATDLYLADRHAGELLAVASQPAISLGAGVTQADAEAQAMGAYVEVLDRLAKETTVQNASDVLHELEAHHEKLLKVGIHVERLEDFLTHARPAGNQGSGEVP